MWKKCTEGMLWTGKTCKGKVKKLNYFGAIKYAKNNNYGKYQNWRIPTINELNSIVYCSNGKRLKNNYLYGCNKQNENYIKPTINDKLFPKTIANHYWSSNEYYKNKMSTVNFSWGAYDSKYYLDLIPIRLVRNTIK